VNPPDAGSRPRACYDVKNGPLESKTGRRQLPGGDLAIWSARLFDPSDRTLAVLRVEWRTQRTDGKTDVPVLCIESLGVSGALSIDSEIQAAGRDAAGVFHIRLMTFVRAPALEESLVRGPNYPSVGINWDIKSSQAGVSVRRVHVGKYGPRLPAEWEDLEVLGVEELLSFEPEHPDSSARGVLEPPGAESPTQTLWR
jgi:hypothetical protein